MSDNIGRIFGIIAGLAALWILVYWWWEPAQRISFDPSTPASARASTAEHPAPPGATVPAATGPVITEPPKQPLSPPKVVVIPPKFRDYIIKDGDTLEAIAERELGSRKLVTALRSANPLMDPEHLKPGRTLSIPLDPTNIQGKPVAAAPAPAESPATAPSAAPSPAPEGSREYTVRSGDTLSGIAKSQYGSTRYKDLIFEANKDHLSSEDDVREGTKLRLPPKPK